MVLTFQGGHNQGHFGHRHPETEPPFRGLWHPGREHPRQKVLAADTLNKRSLHKVLVDKDTLAVSTRDRGISALW